MITGFATAAGFLLAPSILNLLWGNQYSPALYATELAIIGGFFLSIEALLTVFAFRDYRHHIWTALKLGYICVLVFICIVFKEFTATQYSAAVLLLIIALITTELVALKFKSQITSP